MIASMLELIGIILMFAAVGIVGMIVTNPGTILHAWHHGRQEEERRRAAQLAEIDRKTAIADAAIAARARGETFVPPPDYDR